VGVGCVKKEGALVSGKGNAERERTLVRVNTRPGTLRWATDDSEREGAFVRAKAKWIKMQESVIVKGGRTSCDMSM